MTSLWSTQTTSSTISPLASPGGLSRLTLSGCTKQALAARDLRGVVVALRGVTALLVHMLTLYSGASPEA